MSLAWFHLDAVLAVCVIAYGLSLNAYQLSRIANALEKKGGDR
jgi:hypothetical protein